MKVIITTLSKLTIADLSQGDLYYYAGKPQDAFMLLGGSCLKPHESTRYCVNLSTGQVEEPGTACEVRKIISPEIRCKEVADA